MVLCGAVDKLRELYDRYPMMVVRVAGFVLGIPAVCFIMLIIHELLGLDLYQKLYAPVLAALACVHFFFLRRAAARHKWEIREGWNAQNSGFYDKYCVFLTLLTVCFACAAAYGLYEGLV